MTENINLKMINTEKFNYKNTYSGNTNYHTC